MNPRIRQLIQSFTFLKVDALLVLDNPNIRYLTEFPASDSWLFVTRRKAFYITDARYTLEAKKGLKRIAVKEHSGSLAEVVYELARANRVRRIGLDERHISVANYKRLVARAPRSLKFKAVNGSVEKLRVCKDKSEIRLINRALAIHQEALKYIKRYIRPGVTEYEVLNKLKSFVQAKKVSFSFDPIVASGPNSAFPHAHVTERKIRANDVVLLDMGIDYKGYKSDLTRMFYLGRISESLETVSTYVSIAQQKAIAAIAPGVPVKEVDAQARSFLAEKKLAKYFGHALGHGVGLEIHEDPRLAQSGKEILQEGMVITVEPAVYLPNKFGVRLEEMVLVTKKGHKVLSAHIN